MYTCCNQFFDHEYGPLSRFTCSYCHLFHTSYSRHYSKLTAENLTKLCTRDCCKPKVLGFTALEVHHSHLGVCHTVKATSDTSLYLQEPKEKKILPDKYMHIRNCIWNSSDMNWQQDRRDNEMASPVIRWIWNSLIDSGCHNIPLQLFTTTETWP
jgi:hypothetical protein